jgi:hypothetical protein
MIGSKIRAGTDIVDSSSHFPIIGAELWQKEYFEKFKIAPLEAELQSLKRQLR